MNKLSLLRKLRFAENKARWNGCNIKRIFKIRDIQSLIDIFENMTDEEYENLKVRHFE